MSGTFGRFLRLEGISIDLNDNIAGGLEYRTHVQNIEWMSWVKNDEASGSAGYGWRLEGIQIELVEKGGAAHLQMRMQQEMYLLLKNRVYHSSEWIFLFQLKSWHTDCHILKTHSYSITIKLIF